MPKNWTKDHDNHINQTNPQFHWTGFRTIQQYTHYVGQIIWRGIATFRSGRKKEILYYVAIIVETTEDIEYCFSRINATFQYAYELRSWPAKGYLKNYGRRILRPVASVEWLDWNAKITQC